MSSPFLLPFLDDPDRARQIAIRITEALEPPFSLNNVSLGIGASIGIAYFPSHAKDAMALLQCADVAMYLAKEQQADFAFYDQEKDTNSVRSLTLTGELRLAIENRNLTLAYQPKIDLQTSKICSAEALSRWIHPVHGFIPPDEFIAHAELTGLIQPLTIWVLETALHDLRQLRDDGIDIGIAVNLSAKSLLEPNLNGLLSELLSKFGIEPRRLTLEVTESAVMANPEHALTTLNQIHEIGVGLSIDDFGTGYSSLAYLKKLPADELKIDRSFVMGMHEDQSDEQIVRSTIDLAHNLGLKVVAEGVETDVHVELLSNLGCDIGQGYLFSKPLPLRNL